MQAISNYQSTCDKHDDDIPEKGSEIANIHFTLKHVAQPLIPVSSDIRYITNPLSRFPSRFFVLSPPKAYDVHCNCSRGTYYVAIGTRECNETAQGRIEKSSLTNQVFHPDLFCFVLFTISIAASLKVRFCGPLHQTRSRGVPPCSLVKH